MTRDLKQYTTMGTYTVYYIERYTTHRNKRLHNITGDCSGEQARVTSAERHMSATRYSVRDLEIFPHRLFSRMFRESCHFSIDAATNTI